MKWAGWIFYISLAILLIGLIIHIIGILPLIKNETSKRILNWIGGIIITLAVIGLIISGFGLLYI
jgi:hypothetical protein